MTAERLAGRHGRSADTSWTSSKTTLRTAALTLPADGRAKSNAAPSWFDTPYGDWTTVLSRIREMGATNLRASALISTNDGWNRAVWGRLNEAIFSGIRAEPDRRLRLLHGRPDRSCIDAIRTRVPASGVASVEWPNEYDISGDPAWASKLIFWGHRPVHEDEGGLRDARHPGGRAVARRQERPSTLGDQSAYMVRRQPASLHRWLSPTPAHMASERLRMWAVSRSKPLVATEAGFHTVLSSTGAFAGTDEATSANYTVRTFLEHFLSGIPADVHLPAARPSL
jgi:hypothetical protein